MRTICGDTGRLYVETWYDRETRNWVTQLKDDQGNQIGDAVFNGIKQRAASAHRQMVKDHTPKPLPEAERYMSARGNFGAADY